MTFFPVGKGFRRLHKELVGGLHKSRVEAVAALPFTGSTAGAALVALPRLS